MQSMQLPVYARGLLPLPGIARIWQLYLPFLPHVVYTILHNSLPCLFSTPQIPEIRLKIAQNFITKCHVPLSPSSYIFGYSKLLRFLVTIKGTGSQKSVPKKAIRGCLGP
jgi:hypothetical protein